MAKAGDVFIFEDGQKCMVVDNILKKGRFDDNGNYNMWDDSRWLLVNLDTGKVEIHYRHGIPYEHGEPYVPIWGGVSKVIRLNDI